MSKDLKDIINTVEEETKSLSELEATINSLKEEIIRLQSNIKEQEVLINEQSGSIEKSNLPGEIEILKEIIISQRQDLVRKDEANENLNEKIDRLTTQFDTIRSGTIEGQNNKDLLGAQELILKLSEENEEYRNQIDDLKEQFEHKNLEKTETWESSQIPSGEVEDVINLKTLNFHLMEENGLLRIEIESLKSQMQEKINETNSEELQLAREKTNEANSEELQLANEKINALMLELQDYDAQINYLQQQLKETPEPIIISTEDALQFAEIREEYDNIKNKLLKYQEENQRLNNILLELDHTHASPSDQKRKIYPVAFNFPREFQISLFMRMYNLLNDDNRNTVIDILINDLYGKNNDVKRAALKILCEIKDTKVYDAFFDLLNDKNWLIRYDIIKALTKFGFESTEFKNSLKKLSKDRDVDVRELAIKVLAEFYK